MDEVAQLYAARDRVFGALDVLDAASRNAGTPIRSGSPRERFTHLFGVIREVETTARKTWQEELIASRGADLSLSKALAVGAKKRCPVHNQTHPQRRRNWPCPKRK